MLNRIKLVFNKGIRNVFSKKNIIKHFMDAAIALLILFTFFGEPFIGFNLPIIYFIIAMTIYLTYTIYKWICHLQDLFEAKKKELGLRNHKTTKK